MINTRLIIAFTIFFTTFMTIGLWLIGAFGSNSTVLARELKPTTIKSQILPTPTPTPTPPPIAKPVSLNIPKFGIVAPIEEVGVDVNGTMQVPSGSNSVGWLDLGPKPGEQGSAVLDGHYDYNNGSPAIFYNLSKLEVGDPVYIVTADNKQLVFQVTDIKVYPVKEVPLGDIFGRTDKPRLNLITCDGVWNLQDQNYTHRTVVFSELVK
jgi:sortase A